MRLRGAGLLCSGVRDREARNSVVRVSAERRWGGHFEMRQLSPSRGRRVKCSMPLGWQRNKACCHASLVHPSPSVPGSTSQVRLEVSELAGSSDLPETAFWRAGGEPMALARERRSAIHAFTVRCRRPRRPGKTSWPSAQRSQIAWQSSTGPSSMSRNWGRQRSWARLVQREHERHLGISHELDTGLCIDLWPVFRAQTESWAQVSSRCGRKSYQISIMEQASRFHPEHRDVAD